MSLALSCYISILKNQILDCPWRLWSTHKHWPFSNEDSQGQSNLYADIGVKDPESMLMKAQLAVEIGEIIRRRKLSQTKAAKIMGIPQLNLSELLRGRFRAISEAKMIGCLTRLGASVSIVVKYGKQRGHEH
jgi:predicted XRE-type DNA-binding protein